MAYNREIDKTVLSLTAVVMYYFFEVYNTMEKFTGKVIFSYNIEFF